MQRHVFACVLLLTWVKQLRKGFSPLEHEGYVHQDVAQERYLPSSVRCAMHFTLPNDFQLIPPKCFTRWRPAPLCMKPGVG